MIFKRFDLDWVVSFRNNLAGFSAAGAGVAQPPTATVTYTGYRPSVIIPGNKTPIEAPGTAIVGRGGLQAVFAANIIYIPVQETAQNYRTVYPPTGTVFYNPSIPSVEAGGNKAIEPPLGTVTYTGFAPTVSANNPFSVTVPLATVSYTGFAPTAAVDSNFSVEVPIDTITYNTFTPTAAVTLNVFTRPGAGAVTYTGYAPVSEETVGATIDIPRATVVYATFAPQGFGDFVPTANYTQEPIEDDHTVEAA